MTDEQIDDLWIYRKDIHKGELLPQLRDFARALLSASKPAGPITDTQIARFATDARQHEAMEFSGGTKVASHDNVVEAIRRALLAASPAAPAQSGEPVADEEDENIQPTPESDRAAFNAMMRWHLIRLLQAWRYGGDLRAAGLAAFEWARANDIGKAAFAASKRAMKIAAPQPSQTAQSGLDAYRLKVAEECNERLMSACTDAGCPDGVNMADWIRDVAKRASQSAVVLDDERAAFEWPPLPALPNQGFYAFDQALFTEHQMQGYANAYGEAVRAASPQPVAQTNTPKALP